MSMPNDSTEPAPSPQSILEPGRNCWRLERAERAAPLIDAAAYFAALDETFRRAQRQILIVGWDVHAFTRLLPRAGDDAGRQTLRELLYELAMRNRALDIRILLWDFTVLYSPDRLPFPKAVLDWSMPENVSLCLDDRLPLGGCQHQKIVVVDDRVAFVGGIDLTEERWDTPAHRAEEPGRLTARGQRYAPFHDVQLAVSGPVAATLGDLCRDRWAACSGETVGARERESALWPTNLRPTDLEYATLWKDVSVGIARTVPAVDGSGSVQEISELYADAIRSACDCIYIENQYLTADRVRDAVIERLGEPRGPDILMVTRYGSQSWLEQSTMGVRRNDFVGRLEAADRHGRFRAFAPRLSGVALDDYKLHSKVCIVDDRLVRVGSANLNNRSMGLDSECDAVVLCETADDRRAARDFRNTLLAEHLGVSVERVARNIDAAGSVVTAVDKLRRGYGRSLVRLPAAQAPESDELLPELADLERPLTADAALDRLSPTAGQRTRPLRAIVRTAAALVFLIGLVIAWRFTELRELADPDVIAGLLAGVPDGALGGLAAMAIFVAAGVVGFPVTVLIFATAIAFGIWPGLPYAFFGVFASAVLTFVIGRWLGRGGFPRWRSRTVVNVSRQLARRGMLAVALVRIVPVAPFTLVNVVAGASNVKFRDYALGSFFGMAPGIVVLTAMGGQLGAVLRDPSLGHMLILGTLGLLWIGIALGLFQLIRRLEHRRNEGS